MKATRITRARAPLADRLHAKLVEQPNGCIEFVGTRVPRGYGLIGRGVRGSGMAYAHRTAWELANGRPIPEGLLVLHRCDNPPCCNVEHLFLGTQADNMRDMSAKGRSSAQRKTHCTMGHAYDEINTLWRKDRPHGRECRACHTAGTRRRRKALEDKG